MGSGKLPQPGSKLLDRYDLISSMQSGGMGAVFEARRDEQRLAIKFPTVDLVDRTVVDRFTREARVLAKIDNPHVVKIVESSETEEGLPFIVMEFLEGRDLAAELTARGPLPMEEACGLIIQACEGVGAAHALGIVHRDIKPGNLFLCDTPNGRLLKVLDFGVSKFLSSDVDGRTGTTDVLGTPAYMSPEQLVSSASVDVRADVWALGVVLYRCLTNALPFKGETPVALALAITTRRPLPVSQHRAGIPPGLEAVIRRALSKELDQRYATVSALSAALRPFMRGSRRSIAGSLRPQSTEPPESVPLSGPDEPLAPPTEAAHFEPAAPIIIIPEAPPKRPTSMTPWLALVLVALGVIAFFTLRPDDQAPAAATPALTNPNVAVNPLPTSPIVGGVNQGNNVSVVPMRAASPAPAPAAKGPAFDPSACFARVGYWQASGPVSVSSFHPAPDMDETISTCYRTALATKRVAWGGELPITMRFDRSGSRGVQVPSTQGTLWGLGNCIASSASARVTDVPSNLRGEISFSSTITFTCP